MLNSVPSLPDFTNGVISHAKFLLYGRERFRLFDHILMIIILLMIVEYLFFRLGLEVFSSEVIYLTKEKRRRIRTS